MFDPITLLATLAPLVIEGGKAAIQRWLAPDQVKPVTVDDYAKLKAVDLETFKAVNEAGGGNASYPWVEAVIRLQRPFVVACVLGAWSYAHLAGGDTQSIDNAAAIVAFYLFGDRSLFHVKRAAGK